MNKPALRMLAVVTIIAVAMWTRAAAAATRDDISGRWAVQMETSVGTINLEIDFRQSNDSLSGQVRSDWGPGTVSTGVVAEGSVAFTVALNVNGIDYDLEFTGGIEGDLGFGEGHNEEYGDFTWSAQRVKETESAESMR